MVEPNAETDVVKTDILNVPPRVETPVVPSVAETKPVVEPPKAPEKVVTDYEKAYKELQRKHQIAVEETRTLKQRAEANEIILQRLDGMEEAVAKIHDKLPDADETIEGILADDQPKKKASRYEELQQRRAKEQTTTQLKASQQKVVSEILEIIEAEGISQDDPRIATIWTEPSPELGRAKLGKKLAEIHKEERANFDKTLDVKVKEALQKSGLLNVDMSESGGPGKAKWETIQKQYNENPNDPAVYNAYMKARRERGI